MAFHANRPASIGAVPLRFDLIHTGRGTRDQGFSAGWRRIDGLLMEWSLGPGGWHLERDGRPAAAVPADRVLVVGPGALHRLRVPGRALTSVWWVVRCRGADGSDAFRAADLPPFLDADASRRVRALLATPPPAGDGMAAELSRLAAVAAALALVAAAGGSAPARAPGRLARLAQAWTVAAEVPREREDLARRAGLSLSALHRQCLAEFALSPGAWLRRERLRRACALLLGSSLSLAAVAEQCGFPDVFAFSRCFRREFGQPPGRWRTALADRG